MLHPHFAAILHAHKAAQLLAAPRAATPPEPDPEPERCRDCGQPLAAPLAEYRGTLMHDACALRLQVEDLNAEVARLRARPASAPSQPAPRAPLTEEMHW